jgi:hypothetical protein
MRSTWTDSRLDDLAKHTDQRFDGVDRRFDAVDRRFDRLERRMEAGFDRLDARFDSLHRSLMQVGGGVMVALIGLIATQL